MQAKENNVILNLSVDFALEIIDYSQRLKAKNHFEIASQLLRCGTSIGANIWEAQSAESRKDFGHKLKIADKEAHETEYWLLLCKLSKHLETQDENIDDQLISIKKLLNRIISTNKKRLKE